SPKLRDYFSNPGNFEHHTANIRQEISSNLHRTCSETTFDSLDFARYSDDGDRQTDERVAVLEFELRKAKETIKSLRANLTVAAESDPSKSQEHDATRKGICASEVENQPLKPHELRALNYLVNEYLLKHNYKLTSITFSDENEDQDFEDWDDVGLNIAKPPNLLNLYRDFGKHQQLVVDKATDDVAIQADAFEMQQIVLTPSDESVEEELNQIRTKVELLSKENKGLMDNVRILERDLENAVVNNIKSSTPAVTPISTPRKSLVVAPFSVKQTSNKMDSNSTPLHHLSENESLGEESTIPMQLPSSVGTDLTNSLLSTPNSLVVELSDNFSRQAGHVEDLSVGVGNEFTSQPGRNSNRFVPEIFYKYLYNACFEKRPIQEPRLAEEVSEVVDSYDKIVLMLSRCLPHIIPNVILAKREELIPVILGTVSMHPEASERDKLLHLLFNLIKRPNADQRQVILTGFVMIAKHLGPTKVEAELLPQCWEQISHKYVERRLLVAESCGILAPHLPPEIRSSLVVSMLQQMLTEDKVDEVRISAVKSLAVVFAFIDDVDKVNQALELLIQGLLDSDESVVDAAIKIFLPSITLWLIHCSDLENNLVMMLLRRLGDIVKIRPRSVSSISIPSIVPSIEEQRISVLLRAIQSLIPYMFVSIVSSGPYVQNDLPSAPTVLELNRFPRVSEDPLHNPTVIYGDKPKFDAIVCAYDDLVGQEWYQSWEKLDWLHKTFLPTFVKLLCSSQLNDIPNSVPSFSNLIYSMCRTFGRSYTNTKIRPVFQKAIAVSEECLNQVQTGSTALTKCIVTVYAGGVLAVFPQEEDREELKKFLSTVLTTLSLCHASTDSIHTAFAHLCDNSALHELLLSVLWDSVVHTSPSVRITSAKLFHVIVMSVNETLLANKVLPALVTLATDSDMSVRTATVKAFGIVLQTANNHDILDKVKMQFQTFLDDSLLRDHHHLHLELIRTFASISTHLEPVFREEFILPRLAAMALRNNNSANETRRMDVAVALLEAYNALSCCSFSEQIISQALLPGLQCLLTDVQAVAPEHENNVVSMICEFESKIDVSKTSERTSGIQPFSASGMEDMKNKMTKYFSQHRPSSRPNIPNIFQL
ncbi:KIAA1468 (predicted), partial [Pycnogonum litorale]